MRSRAIWRITDRDASLQFAASEVMHTTRCAGYLPGQGNLRATLRQMAIGSSCDTHSS